MSKFNAGKASVLVLTAVFAFVLFLFSGQSVMAVINLTPSTNDTNRIKGWAHVNATPGIGEVALELVQPRNFYSCFEYRTDGDTSQVINEVHPLETWGVVPLGDPLQRYPSFCLSTISSRTEVIQANGYVEVRMIFGAEGDERFDWTRFNVYPAPAPAPTPETCVGDQHLDASGQNCVSFTPAGPPENPSGPAQGQVLGTSTGIGGQVLGAKTMAGTGTFEESLYLAIMSLGGISTFFGAKGFKKAFKKA